jgi:hypothetical protein
MAAPPGAKAARWNQAVSRVATEMGWTNTQADAWLNAVWAGMFSGDEVAADITAHGRLRAFLENASPDSPTLPRAFYDWATA